jgi:hypothetical protein
METQATSPTTANACRSLVMTALILVNRPIIAKLIRFVNQAKPEEVSLMTGVF